MPNTCGDCLRFPAARPEFLLKSPGSPPNFSVSPAIRNSACSDKVAPRNRGQSPYFAVPITPGDEYEEDAPGILENCHGGGPGGIVLAAAAGGLCSAANEKNPRPRRMEL